MIAIISYFNGSQELLNCGGVVAENISVSRDGFYFIPLNRDEVPLGTQIILKQEPIDGLKKYLSNKNFQGIGPKNADSIAQNIGMKVLKYLNQRKLNLIEEKTSKKIIEMVLRGVTNVISSYSKIVLCLKSNWCLSWNCSLHRATQKRCAVAASNYVCRFWTFLSISCTISKLLTG